jgi:polyhydroxyalkanoate synthase subunit PhaC
MASTLGRLDSVRKDVERSVFRAKNGIRYAAGVVRPEVGQSPKELVWTRETTRLFRYGDGRAPKGRRPLVIVWSLASRSYILDLRPGQSLIERFLDAEMDVFLIDWEPPRPVDSKNTLETYANRYLPAAFAAVMDIAGTDEIDVLGYCFGGTLSLLSAAGHPGMPLANLIVMATPVDFSHLEGLIEAVRKGDIQLEDLLDDSGNVPADVVYRGVSILRPTAKVFNYANLWDRMWNDAYVESFQAMNEWLNDQVDMPGAAMAQASELLVRQNQLAGGKVRLGGRTVRLSDIRCPVLNVIAETDHIVPPRASEVLGDLVGSDDVETLRIPAGHIALATGRDMVTTTAPSIIKWLEARRA